MGTRAEAATTQPRGANDLAVCGDTERQRTPRVLRVFFFSGTGNARNVACWLGDAWRLRGCEAQAFDLTKVEPGTIEVGRFDEIGLASPTHGFNYPPVTLEFLFRFPRTAHRNRVFIINTRAGVRLFGLSVPGLSGAAQLLAALVFLIKGYRVVGMRPIDLPSNWISLHPGLREDNIRSLYEQCEAITRRFADRLLDGKRDLRALLDLPQDLAMAPISLGYACVGRFLFAKSYIASSACDGCEACVKQCPVRAIRMIDGRPFWTYRCESCMRCMNQCPKRAIETAHGFIVSVLGLMSLALAVLVYPALGSVFPSLVEAEAGALVSVARFVFATALTLMGLFFSYRLLHRALGHRVFERMAVLSSLTHWRFWRRYKPPKKSVSILGKPESEAQSTSPPNGQFLTRFQGRSP